LILLLAEFLSERDINAAARTCSRLYAVLDHALYVRNVKQAQSSCSIGAAARGVLETAKKAIAARTGIGTIIHRDVQHPRLLDARCWSRKPLTIAAEHNDMKMASLLVEAGVYSMSLSILSKYHPKAS
jgi:hypothetical protein